MADDLTAISPGVGAASYWEPVEWILSAWREHAPFGFWLVSAHRPGTIVELGTHTGYSFFVFAEAVKRLGLDTRLVAVDSWQGDDQAGFYGEDVYQSVLEIARRRYPDSTEFVRARFDEAVSRFSDGSIDLLHIDGRHGYDDVREDFALYLPKLSSRGVVIFHDSNEYQEGFGVHQFWADVSASYPSFEFRHEHGLGVLLVGSEIPTAVSEFVTYAKVNPQAIREVYEELGAGLSARVAAEAQRVAMEEELARLRPAYEAAERESVSARRDLELVRASTSWQVTAPLRSISTFLRPSRRSGAAPR